MLESAKRYQHAMLKTPLSIEQTLSQDLSQVLEILDRTKRIFLYGTGSSSLAMDFASLFVLELGGDRNVINIESLSLLNQILREDDVVILNSFSWNTRDALLLTEMTNKRSVDLIVVTANQEKRLQSAGKRVHPLQIYPLEERIWSRPASSLSSTALLMNIFSLLEGKDFDGAKVIHAYKLGADSHITLPASLERISKLVVLSSGVGMPVARATSLAFREGAGFLHTNNADMDQVIHGHWIGDPELAMNKTNAVHYVVQKYQDTPESSVRRIQEFLSYSGMSYSEWDIPEQSALGSFTTMAIVARAVLQTILSSGYDMNNPIGKPAVKRVY